MDIMASVNMIWILVAAALVFFMQAGFAMVEAGLTRAKNSGNIIMKNLMDFCLGTIVFWVFGYALMHGESIAGIFGIPNGKFLNPDGDLAAHMIFNTVFCATAATIVSGAMAERTRFSCYCLYSVVISIFVYPISGHWIWGGGWLAGIGFHDFAGSTAVHMVGGVAALVGAKILGARIGKFGSDGKPRAIPGHNLTIAALGVFILWFCWFGFNGGSTFGAVDGDGSFAGTMAKVFLTTNMAPAVGAVTCMIITWVRYKKPDVSMCLNGALAGLVAITAGTDVVTPVGAFFIGLIAGVAVIFGIEIIEKKFKIDDPVGAIAVHGICGALGTIMVGVFDETSGIWGAIAGNTPAGEAFKYLGIQILGVVVVIAWVSAVMIPLFLLLKKKMRMRVSPQEEIGGLDKYEHNLDSAYAGFSVMDLTEGHNKVASAESIAIAGSVPPPPAAPVVKDGKTKMTKISMIIPQSKFETLKEAMNKIGVTGMTVTQVMGCGVQKGGTEYYRGSPIEITLLPKVKVEIIVSLVPVATVIDTARRVLYTGNIGDGKIFTYDVEHVVRVRTGEEDFAALQDSDV
ncbi:MAG: ammonium transporter [Clostridiales bacterium]|jgi:Amt family ammonium transporter|nr:ammonium transporter [Clostridiales bacterium]